VGRPRGWGCAGKRLGRGGPKTAGLDAPTRRRERKKSAIPLSAASIQIPYSCRRTGEREGRPGGGPPNPRIWQVAAPVRYGLSSRWSRARQAATVYRKEAGRRSWRARRARQRGSDVSCGRAPDVKILDRVRFLVGGPNPAVLGPRKRKKMCNGRPSRLASALSRMISTPMAAEVTGSGMTIRGPSRGRAAGNPGRALGSRSPGLFRETKGTNRHLGPLPPRRFSGMFARMTAVPRDCRNLVY